MDHYFGFCDVTLMLLRSLSISYFNIKRTTLKPDSMLNAEA